MVRATGALPPDFDKLMARHREQCGHWADTVMDTVNLLVDIAYEGGHEWTLDEHRQLSNTQVILARARGGA